MLKRINTYGSLVLIVILAVVSNSQLTNRHNHIINGVMVSHAHPYNHHNNTPVQDHEHQPGDFALLAFFKDFQHYIISITSVAFTGSITSAAIKIRLTDVNPLPQNSSLFYFCFRGPPLT